MSKESRGQESPPAAAESRFGDANGEGARKLERVGLWLTGFFGALSLVTCLMADGADLVFAIICSALFVVGTLLLALGFWNGIQRSRVDTVTLTGLVAVDTSHVPARARRALWAAIVLQLAIAVLFGSLRPFTLQAFGLLVPTLGLGFAALWGSRFAAFHPREER